jgi:hypothetical protein
MNLGILNMDNSRFEGNSCGNAGGAIHNVNVSNIQNSIFVKNEAEFAGAMSNMIELTLKNVIFEENTAKRDGAALNNQGTIKIFECEFKNNSAGNYGGVAGNMKYIEIRDSVFEGNRAVENAGAINNGTPMSDLKVVNSRFINNSAKYGGVLSDYGGNFTLSNSEFRGNSSQTAGGVIISKGSCEINSCSFISNSSMAGGVLANFGRVILNDSNFDANDAMAGCDINNAPMGDVGGSDNSFTNGEDKAIANTGSFNLKNSRFNR